MIAAITQHDLIMVLIVLAIIAVVLFILGRRPWA
jgi:hypothetical protein